MFKLTCHHCGKAILRTPRINDHDVEQLVEHLRKMHPAPANRRYDNRVAMVFKNYDVVRAE